MRSVSHTERQIAAEGERKGDTEGRFPRGGRFLAVDDDGLIRQVVRDLLKASDFAVAEAADEADGFAQAAALGPDLILLELMRPGMDPYSACRTVKAGPTAQPIPVVFLTASLDPTLNRTAYAAARWRES